MWTDSSDNAAIQKKVWNFVFWKPKSAEDTTFLHTKFLHHNVN